MKNFYYLHQKLQYNTILTQLPIQNLQLILMIKQQFTLMAEILNQAFLDNDKLETSLNLISQHITKSSVIFHYKCQPDIIILAQKIISHPQTDTSTFVALLDLLSQCSSIQYHYSNEIVNSQILYQLQQKLPNLTHAGAQAYCKLLFNLLNDFPILQNLAVDFMQKHVQMQQLQDLMAWGIYIFSKDFDFSLLGIFFSIFYDFLQRNSFRFPVSGSLALPRRDKVVSYLSFAVFNVIQQYGVEMISRYQMLPILYKFVYFHGIQTQVIIVISHVILNYEGLDLVRLQEFLIEIISSGVNELVGNGLGLVKVALEYGVEIDIYEFLLNTVCKMTKIQHIQQVLIIFKQNYQFLIKDELSVIMKQLCAKFPELQGEVEVILELCQ